MNRKEKGFTLVEIIGVIVLMGLVITIGSTTINNIKKIIAVMSGKGGVGKMFLEKSYIMSK